MSNSTNLLKLMLVGSQILLASCSKTPDVRLTLCQDLTQLLLNSSEAIEWQEHKAIIKGYEDLEMQIKFATKEQGIGQASCFYAYEQDDIGPETFQEPTSAYSTYPNKMILMGGNVDKILLSGTINQVMKQQGNKAINKVKEDLEQATKKVMEKIK